MKKLLLLCLACVAALVVLLCVPMKDVQAGDGLSVVLGDGAPVPYLDGFQSRFIRDAQAIEGITGAVGLRWTEAFGGGAITFELENLSLTDDVLALFYKQTSTLPIAYDGSFQHAYDWQVQALDVWLGGGWLPIVDTVCREGRPIDAYSQRCMVVYSLQEPLTDGQAITLGRTFNEGLNAYEGGCDLSIDRSRASDPTRAFAPMKAVSQRLERWEEGPSVSFDYVIERISFTPFGNRCLINFKATGENNAFFDYRLLDDAGEALVTAHASMTGNSTASEEHPVWIRNEAWFYGGESSDALTLVPVVESVRLDEANVRKAVVALDALPADVALESGASLRLESCEVTDGGFLVWYTIQGFPGRMRFELSGSDGQTLPFNYVSYSMSDHARRLLGDGGYWSEEYKGKTVARVTQDDLLRVHGLTVTYDARGQKRLPDAAVLIPLK